MLTVLFALSVTAVLAVPLAIFADDPVPNQESGSTEYGGETQGAPEATGEQSTADETTLGTPATDEAVTGASSDEAATGETATSAPSSSPPTQTPNGAVAGGFGTLGFLPLAGDAEVGTWQELQDAIGDASVTRIVLLSDIQRSGSADEVDDLPVINRSLEIDGNNHSLDLRYNGALTAVNRAVFKLGQASSAQSFSIYNIQVERGNATTYPLISANGNQDHDERSANAANWTINISNLTGIGAPTSGLVSASDSAVVLSGSVTWDMAQTSNYHNINAQTVVFASNSRVSLKSGANVIVAYPSAQNLNTTASVEARPGAQVSLHSYGNGDSNDSTAAGSAIRINEGVNSTTTDEATSRARSLVKVTGANTRLYASSNGNGYGRWGGVIVLGGGGGGGDVSYNDGRVAVEVTGGAKLEVDSFGAMPAMVQQVPRATFKVSDSGSQLLLHATNASGSYDQLRAALRFRYVGMQTFDVSNAARVDITLDAHIGGDPAAIRFGRGPSNDFRVASAGQVYIYNGGNETVVDDGVSSGGNDGIEYDAANFGFYLTGENSIVQVTADKGPAIDANGESGGTISVGEGSIFIARGTTASAGGAIFRSGSDFTFTADHPKFYDFTNARVGGGKIFNVEGSNNSFSSTYSDVAVWGNGTMAGWPYNPIDGNPCYSWTLITYTLSGQDFGSGLTSDDPDFNTGTTSFGPNGLLPYTRISGNNGTPLISSLEPLTNTDKYLRAHATVPEGSSLNDRGVWDDEVWVELEVQPADGSASYKVIATSLEGEDIYAEEYVKHIDGVIRYGNGAFLNEGDSYRVLRAWRGNPNPNAGRLHLAKATDLPQSWFTVTDATPPVPVAITSHTELWPETRTVSGTYSDQAVVGAPHNTDPLTDIFAAIDGVTVTDGSGNTVYATLDPATRSWSYTLPANITALPVGSTVSFVAVDGVGNTNPIGSGQPRHDTILPPATSLEVLEFPVELSSTDKLIGFTEARNAQSAAAGLPAALKDIIGASAQGKPSLPNPYGTAVSVIATAPDVVSFAAETFNYTAWIAKYGAEPPIHLEDYEVPFQLDGYPSYTSSGQVTVFPRDEVTAGIAANNFDITALDATALVAKPANDRDAEFIDRAKAVAWDNDPSTASASRVRVVGHSLPANPVPASTYTVTFSKDTDPSTRITVNVRVGSVNPPVITFLQEPLVIARTAASHLLTDDELKQHMVVSDIEDIDLKDETELFLPNGTAHPTIDSHNTGVYAVEYRVRDSEGASTSATRLVVVNDGRYVIVDENGDGLNDLVLGAQDFVLKQSQVTGNVDQVRSASYAEAYIATGANVGANLSTSLYLTSIPAGYVAGAQPGSYPFVWGVTGYSATTGVTGIVVDADAVYPGTKYDPYALVAKNFHKRLSEAALIVTDADFAGAASAQAYRLVSGLADPAVRVIDRGGFTATTGSYPLTFGVSVGGTPLSTAPPTQVVVTGYVGEGTPPELTLTSPVEVAQFALFDPLAAVTATDVDDGDLISQVGYNARASSGYTTANPVDSAVVGLYPMRYWVFDSDGNRDDENRLVVVNDGSYTLGAGRVLYGQPFLAKLSDVTSDPSLIKPEIISRSLAKTYGDPDGNNEGPNGVSIPDPNGTGGYSKAVGEYDIVLQATDVPSGIIQKNIRVKIVDAEVLEPSTPSVTGRTVYVYGNNAQVTVSEAQAIVNGGDNALLTALGAGVSVAYPDGTLQASDPQIVSVLGSNGATAFDSAVGQYLITISDATRATSIELTISVGTGSFPFVSVTPKPLELRIDATPGFLTDGQIKSGLTATDFEDGDLSAQVTYSITDISVAPGTAVSSIPSNVAGIYRVVYRVEDADGNLAIDSRALIVNDGRYVTDPEYILAARSFVIALSDVTPNSAADQILEYSQAQAWRTDGSFATAEVQQTGGYTNQVRDYSPIIGVSGHPALTRTITAKVFDDSPGPGGGNGTNGDHYAITANNFRINYTDANALRTKVGTAEYGAEFVRRASAQSYDRTDQALTPQGSPELQSDGGFASHGLFDPTGSDPTFRVRLQVAEEPATWVEIEVLVSNANAPQLTVPAIRTVALGPSLTENDYLAGVSAWDVEDGVIPTSAITHDSPVNTSVSGEYLVTYRVTDSDFNTVTATGIIIVGGGNVPVLSYYSPIIIPAAVVGTPNIGRDRIMTAGRITATDVEDGDLTSAIQLTDLATEATPSIPASSFGVYQLLIRVTDSDNNAAEAQVTLIVNTTTTIVVDNETPRTPPVATPPEDPIEDPPIPTGIEEKAGWAILNLLATILSILLLVAFGIKCLVDHMRERHRMKAEAIAIDEAFLDSLDSTQAAGYDSRREAELLRSLAAGQGAANEPRLFLVNLPVLLIGVVALLDVLIILFVTQDFTGPRVIADRYTIVFLLILLIQLLAPAIAAIIHNRRIDRQEPPRPTPLAPSNWDATF